MRCLTIIISTLIAFAVARYPQVRPNVPLLDGRIVGGEPTTIENHPYQLSLLYLGFHTCGASIISTTKALTAAHCTDGTPASYLSVRAGSTYINRGGDVIFVSSICQHPGYNPRTIDNDVSVLKLSTPLSLGATIQTIEFANVGVALPSGTLATVTGWGTTSSGSSLPSQLQRVQVPRVSQGDCREAYGRPSITDNMVCFGYPSGGKDSCQGDSGGPLAIYCEENDTYLQVGVVSWGAGCASPGYPGVYADVTSLSIRDHIDSC